MKNSKKLEKIRIEMESLRELYIKGYITKNIYQNETRKMFEIATKFGAWMKKISEIAKSIQSLHKNSEIEKQNLLESIEFMW